MFDPMKEFEQLESGASDPLVFEKGLRGMFRGMDDLEQFIRFSRYPNVSVYPLAVYRNLRGEAALGDTVSVAEST